MKQVLVLKERVGTIKCASDLFNKIKRMRIDYSQENAVFFYLNSSNKLIKAEVLFKGGLSSCLIDPRTVFRHALKHNSRSIIFAHNHPSGDLKASVDDLITMRKMKELGGMIDIPLFDCIIFNKKEYYSLMPA